MTRPLRIAVIGACPYPVPQGSQVYLRETALALRRAGHEPRLVVYGYGIGDDTSGLPIDRGATVPFSRKTKAGPSFGKPFLDVALVRTLRRVCRQHRIDAVSAHNYEGLLVALCAGCPPIVYHAHNAMQDELPSYFNGAGWARRIGARLDASLPRRADACVVPHDRLRDYLVANGCDADRVHVVAPAIDPVCDAVAPKSSARPPVLYTGNLDAYQNLELLARAMERIDATLKVVSADALEGTPLADLPNVEHIRTSDRAALADALAGDAVFVCPRVSWSGYPMKLLNAMCAGQAIVCCVSSAHPLTHDQNALVVPDNDVDAFAAAIERLSGDTALRERLGNAARATYVQKHSEARFAETLDRVYRNR